LPREQAFKLEDKARAIVTATADAREGPAAFMGERRAIFQQYSFTPQCILVPTDTAITLRATSADAVHGLLIEDTNINLMLVPGYVSALPMRFDRPGEHFMPCQEFCGVGHEGMWAKVKVIDKAEFLTKSSNARRLTCVD
jgi:cytochrome c oxidase subunit II